MLTSAFFPPVPVAANCASRIGPGFTSCQPAGSFQVSGADVEASPAAIGGIAAMPGWVGAEDSLATL